MKIFFITNLFLAWSCLELSGQAESRKFAAANDLFLNSQFASAMPLYLNFLKNDSSNANLHYKIGVCYLNSRSQKGKSVGHLKKAVNNASPIAVFRALGDAYLLTHKFELAIASYEKFRKAYLANKPKDLTVARDISLVEEINWKIQMCMVGKKLQAADSAYAQLDSTSYLDYTSALSIDQSNLTFAFKRPESTKQRFPKDHTYFEDLHIPVRTNGLLSNPDSSSTKRIIDTTRVDNEFTVATSMDGQVVLTYKDNNGDADLFLSRLKGNQWTSPEKISTSLNLQGWEPNEFMSADAYTLYFTSNRPGGFGGSDIYFCKRSSNGEWGKGTNLGPVINTAFDEEAPFIYSDEHTLYFSSNKNKLKCCFDIFSTTLSHDGNWSEPVKVGYPVKTSMENILDPVTTAYQEYSPAAIKEGVYDKRDLYLATFIDGKKTPFTVLKGKVIDINGKVPRRVKITVTDNETAEVLGVYNSNNKTGDYSLILIPGRNNNIAYEADGYLFYSENVAANRPAGNYETHKVVLVSPLTSGSKTTLNNIFFDLERAGIRPGSYVELKRIFLLLSANPDMTVALSYYVDAKENNKFFVKLAEERAQAVANYLIARGINKIRVVQKESGKSKILKKTGKKNSEIEEPLGERLELTITSY